MALYARKYEKKSSYADLQNEQQSMSEFCVEPSNINMGHRYSQSMKNQSIPQNMNNNKTINMRDKLKLLKQRRRHSIPSNSNAINQIASDMQNLQIENNYRKQPNSDPCDMRISEIDERIVQLEQELRNPSLSSAKKYALNKSLKMEKSKIIRYQRQQQQDKHDL